MTLPYFLGHRFFREVATGFFDLTVLGKENAQFEGPALIASNHVSYLDPPFIGSAFDEDICFLARKSLFRFPITNWILTRWQAIHLLPAEWYYRLLGVHGMNMLIFFIIFFEMAVLWFASTALLNARPAAARDGGLN